MYKTKINKMDNPQSLQFPEKHVNNAYRSGFNYFLNPNDKALTQMDREKLYVSDHEVEDSFTVIKEDMFHSINFFVGFAGSGKTTTLRYFFKLDTNLPLIDKNEGIIVCPSFFDAHAEKINTTKDMAAKISAMCSYIEKSYPKIVELFYTEDGIHQFYDFILETKPEILFGKNFMDYVGMTSQEKIRKQLDTAYCEFTYSYEASRLKYYILNYCPNIKKVIIILDDIESLSYKRQCDYIRDYLSFYTCMTNLPKNSRRLTTNIIISLRPHTYRLITHNQIIESYPITNIIRKNPIDIIEYFNKLIAFRESIPNDPEIYSTCHKTLIELCEKFGGKYAKMIVNLTHYNMRKTLEAFSTIINNRTWITKDQDLQLSDLLDKNYVFNNITVIRALSCNEYKLYYNDENCIIPNLLFNTYEKDYGILCLLILNYFTARQYADTLFGIDSKTLQYGYIVSKIEKVFDNSDLITGDDIRLCLDYLYEKKVLRKSIYDENVPSAQTRRETLSKDSILYLSSRGYELLSMFENDSVLMELCREDMYRDYTKCKIQESSYTLMLKKKQNKIFLDLLSIVKEYLCLEHKYKDFAKKNGTITLYCELFGNISVCAKLASGIKKSIDYSNNHSTEINDLYYEITKELDEINVLC